MPVSVGFLGAPDMALARGRSKKIDGYDTFAGMQ
jgi:hypothetical protein